MIEWLAGRLPAGHADLPSAICVGIFAFFMIVGILFVIFGDWRSGPPGNHSGGTSGRHRGK